MAGRMESLPETERARARPQSPWRPSNAVLGFVVLIVILMASYLAFTKEIPGVGPGYTLEAVFAEGSNLPGGAPVRIAGIDVGEVLETRRDGNNSIVRFSVSDEGRPIHEDARVSSRPRIFLEGNNFLDLDPGSPSAPELEDGDVIPVSSTDTSVQLDEVLTALQEPTRDDLQVALDEFGTALEHEPTAAEDRTQDPAVHGLTGAEALNESFRWGGEAGRSSAQVSEAFQGKQARDLSRLIAGAGRTFDAFADEDERLRKLVTNWAALTGALADRSTELRETIGELEPTLRTAETSLTNLSRSLPPLRAFSRTLAPSLEPLPETIKAAGPWLEQSRLALRDSEAGGVARLLKKAMPDMARAADASLGTIREIDLLSRCATDVLIPTGNQVLGGPFSNGQPNYREFFYATVGLGAESQSFDGNGSYLKAQTGGGDIFASTKNPRPLISPGSDPDDTFWANVSAAPQGTQPQLGGMPPKRPDVKCFKNSVPKLNSGLGEVGPPSPSPGTPP